MSSRTYIIILTKEIFYMKPRIQSRDGLFVTTISDIIIKKEKSKNTESFICCLFLLFQCLVNLLPLSFAIATRIVEFQLFDVTC